MWEAKKAQEVPMTYARKNLISLNDTPYYHVVARCVRRAWLWGFNEYAGRDYSQRSCSEPLHSSSDGAAEQRPKQSAR
jgi:hypothetical protein